MSNANGIITAPVTLLDLQQVFGLTGGGELHRLILSAKIGGSVKPGESWARAFWTREYTMTGASGAGDLIDEAEPYFNLFSEQSPVEWEQLGDSLMPRLKKASYIPAYMDINGVSTRITYSFSLELFNGYNHNASCAELNAPASFTSNSTEKSMEFVYYIPNWLVKKMPNTSAYSFYVLTDYIPLPENPYKSDFLAVVKSSEMNYGCLFQARLRGLPQYKDESQTLNLYISMWDYHGDNINIPSISPNDYTFLYSMPNIGKMYHTQTLVTGTKDRPEPIIGMYIIMEMWQSSIDDGWYKRPRNGVIEVHLYNMELIEPGELWSDELNMKLCDLPPGYTTEFIEEVSFPNTNFTHFIVKSAR